MSDVKYDPRLHKVTAEELHTMYIFLVIYGHKVNDKPEEVRGELHKIREIEEKFLARLHNIAKSQDELDTLENELGLFDCDGVQEDYRHHWELYTFAEQNTDLALLTPLFFEILSRADDEGVANANQTAISS